MCASLAAKSSRISSDRLSTMWLCIAMRWYRCGPPAVDLLIEWGLFGIVDVCGILEEELRAVEEAVRHVHQNLWGKHTIPFRPRRAARMHRALCPSSSSSSSCGWAPRQFHLLHFLATVCLVACFSPRGPASSRWVQAGRVSGEPRGALRIAQLTASAVRHPLRRCLVRVAFAPARVG